MQNKITTGAPFQKIQDACATTGPSRYFLHNGCKDGSIPHIKSGGVYYINIPALLKKLEATRRKQKYAVLARQARQNQRITDNRGEDFPVEIERKHIR